MEAKNTKNTEIQSRFDTCPSCKSHGWKSAKLVVLEGTTNTNGSFEGAVTDPGAFSGGVKNFLLSDRWFSWDNPIGAKIGLTSTTGLVEEIKRLMVSHGSRFQMPVIPIEPRKIGVFERIRAVEPKKPPEQPPIPPTPVAPEDKTWYKHFRIEIVRLSFFLTIFTLFNSFFFGFIISFVVALLVYAVAAPTILVASFSGNRRQEKEYRERLQMHSSQVSQAIERHRRDCEQYEKELHAYELQRSRADLQKNEEEQAISLYQKQLADYEVEKSNTMKERELLWERARLCTRCGTAYLGGVEEPSKSATVNSPATRLA